MKHIERYQSVYTAPQLFDLVVDIERYPEFLPWFLRAKVLRRKDDFMWSEMVMGTRLMHKQFTTKALLARPHRVEISSHDQTFECFEQLWTFEPAQNGKTDVAYEVDIRFRSRVLQVLVGASLTDRSKAMMRAYNRRADQLYGPTSQNA